jgi:hypothetical protein
MEFLAAAPKACGVQDTDWLKHGCVELVDGQGQTRTDRDGGGQRSEETKAET